jgi:DNA-binding MarR family transcriptional regulator
MSPDIDETRLDAWRALLNAHAAMTQRIEEGLAAADLPPLAWYDVLWSLYRAPGRMLRAGELSDSVVTISRSGLTRLVDRIEAGGMLERRISTQDRRVVEIAITGEGRRLLRRMWPVYARVLEEHWVALLGKREAAAVAATLERVHASARGESARAA